MKIAILFFGRIKHYERKFLLSVLPSTQIDVFYSSDNEPQELINDFIKLYNPISIVNDKITYDSDFGKYPNNKTCPVNIHNMTCHFINKKRVFELLERHMKNTNTSYDIIIASRLDISLIEFNLEYPFPDTIYIPFDNDYGGINDRFAFGNFETMKKYMNVYDSCTYLLENGLSIPHPESLTLDNIKHHKLSIKRFNIGNCDIHR